MAKTCKLYSLNVLQTAVDMADFLHASGMFYAISGRGQSYYFCDGDDETLSFPIKDYGEETQVDGVLVVHRLGESDIDDQFRRWIRSLP